MNIQVATKRLKESSGELRNTEINLSKICEELEEAAGNLIHSDDEAEREVSRTLSKTIEEIRKDLDSLKIMNIALIKATELYTRTEERVQSFEDADYAAKAPELKSQSLSIIKDKTSETFETL